MPTWWPSNRRSQLSRIWSKTGLASASEPDIRPSTSDSARCCSSASCVSLNRRTFSMAIAACAAKVSKSRSSYGEKGYTLKRPAPIAPITSPALRIGTAATVCTPCSMFEGQS